MKRLGLLLICAMFFGQGAFAEYYEREGNHIYRVRPYKELWSSIDGVKVTAQLARKHMFLVLENMVSKRILPEAVVSAKDLEKYREYQNQTDDLVGFLNEFVKEQRLRNPEFEKLDLIPNAVVLMVGGKVSIALGKGVGASGALGWVIMPVKVEKIDLTTNKLVEEYASIRSSLVFWPALDAGLGIGGGLVKRIGMAFVWGDDTFVNPDQFWGGGIGASFSPVTVLAGGNFKIGSILNWKGPTRFMYAMGSFDFGPIAEAGALRVNAAVVTSAPAVLSLFDRTSELAYNDEMRKMTRAMDQMMREKAAKARKGEAGEDFEIPAEPPPVNKPR